MLTKQGGREGGGGGGGVRTELIQDFLHHCNGMYKWYGLFSRNSYVARAQLSVQKN